ncbi:MAG: hypothetical protein LIP00_05145 [Parabacteroides sp.]|nr:hypothetical protein [Parabacteroides sp.]
MNDLFFNRVITKVLDVVLSDERFINAFAIWIAKFIKVQKEFVSQNEAYRIFGRKTIDELGDKVERHYNGNRIEYRLSDLFTHAIPQKKVRYFN